MEDDLIVFLNGRQTQFFFLMKDDLNYLLMEDNFKCLIQERQHQLLKGKAGLASPSLN